MALGVVWAPDDARVPVELQVVFSGCLKQLQVSGAEQGLE